MTGHSLLPEFLLALLDGSEFATALRRGGKPARVRLPDDPAARRMLVDAHISGSPMTLTFCAEHSGSWQEKVPQVILAGYCPASDGKCRWTGIDLDATDHGTRGLIDPAHAARVITERADNAGLKSGLVVARSRRGQGRHVLLVPPNPINLNDAAIAIASVVASAFRIATRDVQEGAGSHAFMTANGVIAQPGDAGAVEIIPRSTRQPNYGWSLTLPGAGAFANHGGGVIVDPYEDEPVTLHAVPRCDPVAWESLIREARAVLPSPLQTPEHRRRCRNSRQGSPSVDRFERIDSRTRVFLDGNAEQGARNDSAFAASANLLGCGADRQEAEALILAGAAKCGLPEHEARAAFQSAAATIKRRAVVT